MTTEERIRNVVKDKGLYPDMEWYEKKLKRDSGRKSKKSDDEKLILRIEIVEKTIRHLATNSDTYDFIINNYILDKPAGETKNHFHFVETVLNANDLHLRRKLGLHK